MYDNLYALKTILSLKPAAFLIFVEQYINEIQQGICDPKAQPQVEEEFTSVAVVNGNNGFGQITGKFCMDIAMEKALGTGIGMVAAKVK